MGNCNTYTSLREANIARQKEWPGSDAATLGFRSIELSGEIGEVAELIPTFIALVAASGRAANIVKKLERERLGIQGSRSSVEALGLELADVAISNDLLATQAGLNLDIWVVQKFNEISQKQNISTMMGLPFANKKVTLTGKEISDISSHIERAVNQGGVSQITRILYQYFGNDQYRP